MYIFINLYLIFVLSMRLKSCELFCQVMTQADLGLADAYINGDFSFVDKDEGHLNLFLVIKLISL